MGYNQKQTYRARRYRRCKESIIYLRYPICLEISIWRGWSFYCVSRALLNNFLAGPANAALYSTSEGLEGTEGDCKSWDPAKKYSQIYTFDDKYFESNRFCGDNGEVVWLLNMKRSTKKKGDCTTSAVSPGVSHCENPTFEQLPGWDTLLDGEQWGGVKRAEMVTAAVRAWKKNGKKNGWESADPTTPQGQEEMQHGTNAIGMVNIPVCSFSEAFGNAWPDIKTDNWPCN